MSGFDTMVRLTYLAAAACFVLGLHLMNSPATARRGNRLSASAMAVAVATTAAVLVHDQTIGRKRRRMNLDLVAGKALEQGLARDPQSICPQRHRPRGVVESHPRFGRIQTEPFEPALRQPSAQRLTHPLLAALQMPGAIGERHKTGVDDDAVGIIDSDLAMEGDGLVDLDP